MTYTISVTSQGQISIPAKLRQKLGFEKTRKALITEEDGRLIVAPVEDFLDLAGSIKTNKSPLSNKELNNVVGKEVANEYAKKLKRMK